MDHIIAESQQQPCSSENCELCSYRSMNDAHIQSELNRNKKQNVFISDNFLFFP